MSIRSLVLPFGLAALAMGIVACSATTPASGPNPPGSPNPGDAVMSAVVTIQNFKYVPEEVTLKKGGTITWKNMDAAIHDAKPSSNAVFTNPGDIAGNGGMSKAVVFDKVGAESYTCSYHPMMHGKVNVVP